MALSVVFFLLTGFDWNWQFERRKRAYSKSDEYD